MRWTQVANTRVRGRCCRTHCLNTKKTVRASFLKDEGSQEEEVLGLLASNLAQLYRAQATMRWTGWTKGRRPVVLAAHGALSGRRVLDHCYSLVRRTYTHRLDIGSALTSTTTHQATPRLLLRQRQATSRIRGRQSTERCEQIAVIIGHDVPRKQNRPSSDGLIAASSHYSAAAMARSRAPSLRAFA